MRSKFARVAIATLLVAGSVGCHGASAPATSDTKAAPKVQQNPSAVADCTPPKGPFPHPDYCSYPENVRAFIDDRDACDYWRGEPWPEHEDDPQEIRKNQILAAVEKSCTGADKRLSTMKATYVKDPHIMQLLDEYETDVEFDD